jgi:5'(3')-deoxyribonucleotidase
MDEVLAQFNAKILKRWNAVSGKNFTREDIVSWRMEEVLGRDTLGRSAEGLIDEWIGEPGFYEDLEPVPHSIDNLQELMDLGHEVIIATSIPEIATNAFDGKRKWMRKYFPKWSMKNFISCSHKGVIDGDVFIDDGGHNIIDWCKEGKSGALLMDAPWNRYLNPPVHGVPVVRVFDWFDVRNEIRKIEVKRFNLKNNIIEPIKFV